MANLNKSPNYGTYPGEGGATRGQQEHELTTVEIVANQSQDYIDEKELEYLQTIQHLADEQERVQKKTFTNWINACLAQHMPPLRVNDLIEDMQDGTRLIALLEVLSGEKLPQQRGRVLRKPHFLSNVNTGLQFLERKRVKLVNINASDVVDGRPAVVLGLIWTIILYFQIEENTRLLAEQLAARSTESIGSLDGGSRSGGSIGDLTAADSQFRSPTPPVKKKKPIDRIRAGARNALLQWVRNIVTRRFGVEVNDFGISWRDGKAFLALICAIRPDLFDWSSVDNIPSRHRLIRAFSIAEKDMGIPQLLDAEDVDVINPDEKSIMTYVAQFLHRFPETSTELIAQQGEHLTVSDVEKAEYDELVEWLNKADNVLRIVDRPTRDREWEFVQLQDFKSEMAEKAELYKRIKLRLDTHIATFVTPELFKQLEQHWKRVETQLKHWQWILDSSLPGQLGQIGDWLNQAEDLLASDILPLGIHEEAAVSILNNKLKEHKEFFEDLPNHQHNFIQLTATAPISGVSLAQLSELSSRLSQLAVYSRERQRRLEYELARYRLLALFTTIDNKLKVWKGKLSNCEDVEKLQQDAKVFITDQDLYEVMEKLFNELCKAAEVYKREGTSDHKEIEHVGRFLKETTDHGQILLKELLLAQNSLDEAKMYWQRYLTNLDAMRTWLLKAHTMVNCSEDEKTEFFQDLSRWNDVLQVLNDSGNFLIATCSDDISATVKQQLLNINAQWDSVFPKVQEYLHAGDVIKNKRDYKLGLVKLRSWLKKSEVVLSETKKCDVDVMQAYIKDIQQLQIECEEMEALFKTISKKAQALIPELSRGDVDKMMNDLKKEKELLLTVRATVPSRLYIFHQLLAQREALDASLMSISKWLQDAENVLASHVMSGGTEEIQSCLNRHRACFSNMPYHASFLESNNRVFKTILKSVVGSQGIETAHIQETVFQLNERFQECAVAAEQWEQQLEEALRLWHDFHECEKAVVHWLQIAEKLLNEKAADSRYQEENHKAFFDAMNENLLNKMISAAQNLLSIVSNPNPNVERIVTELQQKWQDISSRVPQHLLKLEFLATEDSLKQLLQEVESELMAEQHAYNTNSEDLREVLQRHTAFFQESSQVTRISSHLEKLTELSQRHAASQNAENTLYPNVDCRNNEWLRLKKEIADMHTLLLHVPHQWQEYEKRFSAMVNWMDCIDEAVLKMNQDAITAKEFEEIEARFKALSEEINNHREDMKWLVQQLDLLVAHCSEPDAVREQQRLEALITRYKTLLPTIETTIVKVDTVSKCFLYREEVEEITEWLKEVHETMEKEKELVIESFEKIESLIKQQETLIKKLEEYRTIILSSLQKGRELQSDNAAPSFVDASVHDLEQRWNEAYNLALAKLSKLKGAQKIWSDYEVQKKEIFRLLNQAEEELQKINVDGSFVEFEKEFRQKQTRGIELKDATESMLKQLQMLSSALSETIDVSQKPLLEKEITEIEKQMHITLTTVNEKMEYLEDITLKWTTYNFQLEELRKWLQKAKEDLEKLKSVSVTPEAKSDIIENLQIEFDDKLQILINLEKEGSEIFSVEHETEQAQAQLLQHALEELRMKVEQLHEELKGQKLIICEQLNQWSEYQDSVQKVQDWVEQVQAKIAGGQPKPKTKSEGTSARDEIKLLYQDVEDQIVTVTTEVTDTTVDKTELIGCLNRLKEIKDLLQLWLIKMDSLLESWETLTEKFGSFVNWLENLEKTLSIPLHLKTPIVEALEKQMDDLKILHKEVIEHQAETMCLTQDCDNLSQFLSPEGFSDLKLHLSDIKARLTQVMDSILAKQSSLSDAIILSKEFQNKLLEFQVAISRLQQKISLLNEVYTDRVDHALQSVKSLKQECADLQASFNDIYNQIKAFNAECAVDEVNNLNQIYSKLTESYQQAEDLLGVKERLLQRWLVFQNWQTDTVEQLKWTLHNLETQKASKVELNAVIQDLDNTEINMQKFLSQIEDLEALSKRSMTIIKDRPSDLICNVSQMINDVKNAVDAVKNHVVLKEEELKKFATDQEQFQSAHSDLAAFLKQSQQELKDIALTEESVEAIQMVRDTIQHLQQRIDESGSTLLTNFREKGHNILRLSLPIISDIQSNLSECEHIWEILQTELREKEKQSGIILSLWQQCNLLDRELRLCLDEEKVSVESLFAVPCDLIEVQNFLDKAKSVINILNSARPKLELLSKKIQQLKQQLLIQFPEFELRLLPENLENMSKLCQSLFSQSLERSHNLEAQLVFWSQIEQNKEELFIWLNNMSGVLKEALTRPDKDGARIKWNMYKSELLGNQSIFDGLKEKIAGLLKLNGENSISSLDALKSLITAQFEEVALLAAQLEEFLTSASKQENTMRAKIQSLSEWLNAIKVEIAKLDISSGSEVELLQRLNECKQLECELQKRNTDFSELGDAVEALTISLTSSEMRGLVKEYENLKKRYSHLCAEASRLMSMIISALEKRYQVQLQNLQRWLSSSLDKISWCSPEMSSDNYSIEAKVLMLHDVEDNVEQGLKMKQDYDELGNRLTEALPSTESQKIALELENMDSQWKTLQHNLAVTKGNLLSTQQQWQNFKAASEEIAIWLKQMEARVKSETTKPQDLLEIGQQFEKGQLLQEEIVAHRPVIDSLSSTSQNICCQNVGTHINSFTEQLVARFNAINKAVEDHLHKLKNLMLAEEAYDDAYTKMKEWLEQAEEQLRSQVTASPSVDKPLAALQNKMRTVKEFLAQKNSGQTLMNDAVKNGEALYSYVAVDGREKIRSELRSLRDKWENYWEHVNQIHKRLELAMMQWMSFDDNVQQIAQWLQDMKSKLEPGVQLKPSLQEKKNSLQNVKGLYHDILAHQNVIERLEQRVVEFDEGNMDQDISELQQDYVSLCGMIKEQVALCEKYVADHESFLHGMEKFADWVTCLTGEMSCVPDISDSSSVRIHLDKLKNIGEQKDQGEALLGKLEEQHSLLVQNTEAFGHEALNRSMTSVKELWNNFLQQRQTAVAQLEDILGRRDGCDQTIAELTDWLRVKESQVKDQPLKSTLEAKIVVLDKLLLLEEEIINHQDQIIRATQEAQLIEGDPKMNIAISQINSRYHALKNMIQEVIARWKMGIEDQQTFNKSYAECEQWLEKASQTFSELNQVMGDIRALKAKKSRLQELIDEKSLATDKMETVVDLGEKLYSHTAPEGREAIRQLLQSLQERWDLYGGGLTDALWKLDGCLQQFESFLISQEQMAKWLQDIEQAVGLNSELRSTLQEKKVQRQNQKAIHEEIQSHKPLVDALCDKAEQLKGQTQEENLGSSISSIKQQYEVIGVQSQELLEKLDQCIDDHQNYLTISKGFHDWLALAQNQLGNLNDVTGEFSVLQKRVVALKDLAAEKDVGKNLFCKLQKAFDVVVNNSSEPGKEILWREMEMHHDAWNVYDNHISCLEKELQSVLQMWEHYNDGLEKITEWLKDKNSQMKIIPLQSTADEKKQQLEAVKVLREVIVRFEPEIDRFTDEAHALLQHCAVDHIKGQLSTISSQYQSLHTESKELVTKWDLIAEDHNNFDQRVQEFCNWCDALQVSLNKLTVEANIEDRIQKLQVLHLEKERCPISLSNIVTMGEKLFPDTATSGRDCIRLQLRDLREKWDALENDLCFQNKKLDTLSQQYLFYTDSVQQITAWIDSVEKNMEAEGPAPTSLPELRSYLLRLKNQQQDILFHKRFLENLKEKALAIMVPANEGAISAQVADISARYDAVGLSIKNSVNAAEDMLNELQKYHDAQMVYSDWQRQMWERLSLYSDFSGSKTALQAKLDKIQELSSGLSEGEAKLIFLTNQANILTPQLNVRSKEALEKDLMSFRNEYSKLASSIGEVQSSLSEHVKSWSTYESSLEKLLSWLLENEEALKEFTLKTTLEEKTEQLQKYQDIVNAVTKEDGKFDEVCQAAEELIQISGETRVSVTIQQVITRYQSLKITAKEILKKCEQQVQDHQQFLEKHTQFSLWLHAAHRKINEFQNDSGERNDLKNKYDTLKELLQEKPQAVSQLNAIVNSSEKVLQNTSSEGRYIVRSQVQDLQQAFDSLYERLSSDLRDLDSQLNQWSEFDEGVHHINDWLADVKNQLGDKLSLHATLEEKKAQLQAYRVIAQDIHSHHSAVQDLKLCADAFPVKDQFANETIAKILNTHQELSQKVQTFIENYEHIVSNHQQFGAALKDAQTWLASVKASLIFCSDVSRDRITLQSIVERVKNLQCTLPDEEPVIKKLASLGERVIDDTTEAGQQLIRTEIDAIEQDLQQAKASMKALLDNLNSQLALWNEYENNLEKCLAWIKVTDSTIHTIDLKATLPEKCEQLEFLKSLQASIRAKELEIDAVMDHAQQLHCGVGGHRSSMIADLSVRYQQISSKIKELVGKWQQYIASHHEYESHLFECKSWLVELNKKLSCCADFSNFSLADQEAKSSAMHELLLSKDEGHNKIQQVVEMAQNVLANTAPSGHEIINKAVSSLQDEWSSLASRITETKALLDETIQNWASFLDEINQFCKTVEQMETLLKETSPFQGTLAEKKTQVEKLKTLEHKINAEANEAYNIRSKVDELVASEQHAQVATLAQENLSRFDALSGFVKNVTREREKQLNDHQIYKDACNDLVLWINKTQESIPSMTRSLGDRLALEAGVTNLEQQLSKMTQGQMKVDHMMQTGEAVLNTTSPSGQDFIIIEMKSLQQDFENLVKDIGQQKEKLEKICTLWRQYKEEYEIVSDWLQQMDSEVKNHKTALKGTVEEKLQAFKQCKIMNADLLTGQEKLDGLTRIAEELLASHLDTYVSNQQRHLNTRYQVLVNLAKDVLGKVEQNFENHKQFEDYSLKAKTWMDEAKEIIRDCSDTSGDRESLQAQLDAVQSLMQKQDAGSNLVHNVVSWGEKTARASRPDVKEEINRHLNDIQMEWDRLVNKMSNAKVSLESSLLQWADYNSSYRHLKDWLNEREAKLQQVLEAKVNAAQKGLGEKRAMLRKTNSFVMDIVSFEPMIESVSSKAEELLQKSPSSGVASDATEIATKYQMLSYQARDLLNKQRLLVEKHQLFTDASNDFLQWLRAAREKLAKCAEAVGDRDVLKSKMTQIKVLEQDLVIGSSKLAEAVSLGDNALAICESDEAELITEEMDALKTEFEQYQKSLNDTKVALDVALTKWTEYDDHLKICSDWLTDNELTVQNYLKLQPDLNEKRQQLEMFQVMLQTIFDWQKELDMLNIRAQHLLETCSDSRISNAVTQLSTKYYALLSLAKEVMRRLEQHFQEHQQQQCMYSECIEWIEKTREKLADCCKPTHNLDELNNKLQSIKNLKTVMEQGQNRLRYLLELKEKVIANTDPSGVIKIQENTDSLQQEFEKLAIEIADARNQVTSQIAEVEDLRKTLKLFSTWLQEMEEKIQSDAMTSCTELPEKKAKLEKYRALQKDIAIHNATAQSLQTFMETAGASSHFEIPGLLERLRELKTAISDTVELLEKQIGLHEKFKDEYQKACDWLMKTKLDVQECSECVGDQVAIEEKLSNLSQIASGLSEGKVLIDAVKECAASFSQLSSDESEFVRQDLEYLNQEWEHINAIVTSANASLQRCLDCWQEFEHLYSSLSDWMAKYEEAVKSEIKSQDESQTKTVEHLNKCKSFLEEAELHKHSLDELNEKGDLLLELCSFLAVREQAVHLLTTHMAVVASLQSQIAKIERGLKDYTEYSSIKEEFEQWLHDYQCAIDENSVVAGEETLLHQRLDALKQLAVKLSEGQQLLSSLSEFGAKALNAVATEQQEAIRNEIRNAQESVDNVVHQLNHSICELKAVIARLQDFSQSKAKLQQWITDVSERMMDTPIIPSDIAEIRTQLESHKHLLAEIESRQSDIQELSREAEEMAKRIQIADYLDAVHLLANHCQDLIDKCKKLIELLEVNLKELQDYQLALQESEKWLLQTSFQLMAHNSLYITSLSQTEDQLKQHEVILSEIEGYGETILDVKNKGQKIKDNYRLAFPQIENEINRQLTNIQESYNSLVATAQRIKKRLDESLKKFQEYEDSLNIINTSLDKLDPGIANEQGVSPHSVEEAKNHQNVIRNILNQLNLEKQRLQAAVQCCEDATASLSRPSSPEGGPPIITNEKELKVKLRLEDSIDQAENVLAAITKNVNEWEELDRRREELRKWMKEREAQLIELRSKPYRLRTDAARVDANKLQDLKTQVEEKRNILEDIEARQSHLAPSSEDDIVRSQILQLEDQINELIDSQNKTKQQVEDYRNAIGTLQGWYDNLLKRFEMLERGDILDNKQKLDKIKEMTEEIETQKAAIEELQSKAADIMPELGGLDVQQMEEQIKSTEKKICDAEKRVARQLQMIEILTKQYDVVVEEIATTEDWIKEKTGEIMKETPLGFKTGKVAGRIKDLNSLQHEAKGKSFHIEGIRKQVEDLFVNLDPLEIERLHGKLQHLEEKYKQLCDCLNSLMERLIKALEEREKFEADLEKVQHWLSEKIQSLVNNNDTIPLKSSDLEKSISGYKNTFSDVDEYENTTISDLKKQANNLSKECDSPQDSDEIVGIIHDIDDMLGQLKDKIQDIIGVMSEKLSTRKEFEKNMDKCQHWLDIADIVLGVDIRPNSSTNSLEDNRQKFRDLLEESKATAELLNDLSGEAEHLQEQVNEAERLILQSDVNALKDRLKRTLQSISGKLTLLDDLLKARQQYESDVQEKIVLLKQVEEELKILNQPIGPSVENATAHLKNYQDLLCKLQDIKDALEDLQKLNASTVTDLESLLTQLHDFLQQVEAQISRLRQMIMLRQQFQTLITEIILTITKYTDIVAAIETADMNVAEKIRKYQDILNSLVGCEANLMAATDKGRKIAEEGTNTDRNSIMEQLQNLKEQLNNLKRLVEERKAQHEIIAEELNKLMKDLSAKIDWLHSSEAAVKSRPLLKVEVDSPKQELQKCSSLEKEVTTNLDEIQSLQGKLEKDYDFETLPAAIQERVSEAKVLRQTLPTELEGLRNYLLNARSLREQYFDTSEKLKAWIEQAEDLLQPSDTDQVNYEYIAVDLDKHKEVFDNEDERIELMDLLVTLGEKIMPSLMPQAKEALIKHQGNLQSRLMQCISAGNERRDRLEGYLRDWCSYQEMLSKASDLLSDSDSSSKPISSPAELQNRLYGITSRSSRAKEHQAVIDLLNDEGRKLSRLATEDCQNMVNQQIGAINDRWKKAKDKIEADKKFLQDLQHEWEVFAQLILKLTSALLLIEQRFNLIDFTIQSKKHLEGMHRQLKNVLSELDEVGSQVSTVRTLAESLRSHAPVLSEVATKAIQTDADDVTSRHKRLCDAIESKVKWAQEEITHLENLEAEVSALQIALGNMQSDIDNLDVYDPDEESVESTLKQMKDRANKLDQQVTSLKSGEQERYKSVQQTVPVDAGQQLSSLELLSESMVASMEDKDRDMKRARTIRYDFTSDVEFVQSWLQQAEAKILDKTEKPENLRHHIQRILADWDSIEDRLNKVKRDGQILVENTQNSAEQTLIQNTVSSLADQLLQVKSTIEDRREQISSALESWQRFLQAHESLKMWLDKTRRFLASPLSYPNLASTKQKHAEYQGVLKECSQSQKHILEMVQELEKIIQVCNPGDLPKRLADIEQEKVDVESEVQQRSALLGELTEEWEQCDKKIKEVAMWLEKAKQSIDSPHNKKKSLRDQLGLREKMLADIAIQRAKVSMSIEKLTVHLKGTPTEENQVIMRGKELLSELNTLQVMVAEQVQTLESSVAQLEHYQQEIQRLKSHISQAEQQLRIVSSPAFSPRDHKKQLEEQHACHEKIKQIQEKIAAVSERIKGIIQRGTPDPNPIYS